MFDAYPTSLRTDFFRSNDELYNNKELKFIIKKKTTGNRMASIK